jgi:hypothetical protein
MAHVVDSEKREQLIGAEAGEKLTDKARKIQYDNVERIAEPLQDKLNITNAEYQLGRPLTTEQFEAKLLKVNPNFRFFTGRVNTTMRYIGVEVSDGIEYATCFQRGVLPEHSIMDTEEEEVRDFSIGNPSLAGSPAIQRSDVMLALEKAAKTGEEVDRTAGMGWKKVKRLNTEVTRGWRTVLVQLLNQGWIRLADVEREFGNGDRQAWQEHTGKAELTLPY